jgi:hypothetical protein
VTSLRWILGGVSALMAAAWLLLVALSDGFRRSFGASPVDAVKAGGPLVVMLLVLATAVHPARWLLHLTAAVLAAVVIGLLFVLRESVPTAIVGLLYCALWFLYYWRAVR